MPGRLHNSLVEMAVMVGINQNTGLKPVKPQPLTDSMNEVDDLFSTAFQAHLLAAVSGHMAIFPFESPRQDDSYPPSTQTSAMGMKKGGESLKANPISGMPGRLPKGTIMEEGNLTRSLSEEGIITPVMKRRISRRVSFAMTRKPSNVNHNINIGPTELPVSYDVLSSLATLCFPDYAAASQEKPEDRVHYLVLTDITGVRSYAACLTFHRPFVTVKETLVDGGVEEEWQCVPWTKAEHPTLEQDECLVYLPTCVLLISKYPYFTTMKDCLSRLVWRIRLDPEDIDTHVKDVALQLTRIPVPPAGKLALKFLMDQVVFTLLPPAAPKRPVVDIPLNLIFECFPLAAIMRLLTAILTQQRVVFVASSYALLTVVMESLLAFIMPFHWLMPYVPVLSQSLLELVDAPGAFLMGCNSSHRHQVEGVEGLVIADIDLGEVTPCTTLTIPSMPQGAVTTFEVMYKRLQGHFDVVNLERPTAFMYEDMKADRERFERHFNHGITQMFLHLMVNLFRDVVLHLKVERRFFNREQFLDSVTEEDKLFYQNVLETEMFSQFLKERFSEKRDYWSELEQRTRPHSRNSFDVDRNSPLPRMSRSGSLMSSAMLLLSLTMDTRGSLQIAAVLPDLTYFQIPNFIPDRYQHFYTKTIDEVTDKLEACRSAGLRASYLYVRAMLKAASGHSVGGLEDFHSLWAYDARLFPAQTVSEMLRSLSDKEKETLYSSAFYKKNEEMQNLSRQKQSVVVDQHIIMDFDKIPRKDVDLKEFAELVQILEIAADHDIITRLFEALTLRHTQVLDPATFELFYECWKETEMQYRELSVPDLQLDPSECFLKVSNMIKTSFGTGRIGLTQKRLFFLHEGSDRHREIITLRDIRSLEKVSMTSFLVPVPALKVSWKGRQKGSFVAWLKEARDGWYLMMMEMWSGKLIAEEMRDPAIIHQAAQNVLLLDALLLSGQEVFASHHTAVKHAAGHLCFFTRRKEEGIDQLPPETKDVLQHRVDPNVREPERRAVEALLYTAGNRSNVEDDHGPKLWCGMANGKLHIFDASTWLLEHQHIQAKDRIVCLLAVGESQVWAGSFDSTIYVIDTVTKSCNQTLMEHTDMVCGMTMVEKHRMVFSASLNGQIIGWDMDTLQRKSLYTLPGVRSLKGVQYYDNALWCCCGDELLVLTLDGSVIKRAQYRDNDHAIQIDCFLISPQNEVWLGCGRRGEIAILDADVMKVSAVLKVECRGISKLVQVQDKVWVGSKDGVIYIFNIVTHKLEKTLKAHTDAIRSMCCAQSRYIMSGAGSHDGKVAIWRTSAV